MIAEHSEPGDIEMVDVIHLFRRAVARATRRSESDCFVREVARIMARMLNTEPSILDLVESGWGEYKLYISNHELSGGAGTRTWREPK